MFKWSRTIYSRWVLLFKATCNCRHYFQSELESITPPTKRALWSFLDPSLILVTSRKARYFVDPYSSGEDGVLNTQVAFKTCLRYSLSFFDVFVLFDPSMDQTKRRRQRRKGYTVNKSWKPPGYSEHHLLQTSRDQQIGRPPSSETCFICSGCGKSFVWQY